MNYFHLSPHLHGVYFRDDLIFLALREDRYFVFDSEKASLLELILRNQWQVDSQGHYVPKDNFAGDLALCQSFINVLLDSRFMNNQLHADPYPDFANNNAAGVEEIDWLLPLSKDFKIKFSWPILKALCTLIRVHFRVSRGGFYSLINLVNKSFTHKKTTASKQDIAELVDTVNHACLLYPTRTKCLEWAATMVVLGLRRGFNISLNIGVQNYPFLAHAWAEVDGQVVADCQDLKNNLAVILSAPNSMEKK